MNKEILFIAYCPKCNSEVDAKYPALCLCKNCNWSGALAHCKIKHVKEIKITELSDHIIKDKKGEE